MSLTPSNIFACWNGHKSCHDHERNAVQCALEIAALFDGDEIFDNVPWTVLIAGGTGVVGTAGSDHRKATVILGAVPHLIDLMSHLAHLYPHTIVPHLIDRQNLVGWRFERRRALSFVTVLGVQRLPSRSHDTFSFFSF